MTAGPLILFPDKSLVRTWTGVRRNPPAPTAEQVLTSITVAYFFISTINIGV
jgi:hypothetical protein